MLLWPLEFLSADKCWDKTTCANTTCHASTRGAATGLRFNVIMSTCCLGFHLIFRVILQSSATLCSRWGQDNTCRYLVHERRVGHKNPKVDIDGCHHAALQLVLSQFHRVHVVELQNYVFYCRHLPANSAEFPEVASRPVSCDTSFQSRDRTTGNSHFRLRVFRIKASFRPCVTTPCYSICAH